MRLKVGNQLVTKPQLEVEWTFLQGERAGFDRPLVNHHQGFGYRIGKISRGGSGFAVTAVTGKYREITARIF